jgi:hypothetical protein
VHHFYFPDVSHLQPLAALARSATWQPLAPAATSSSSHVPAIWQPLAANLKKSEIYKITFFSRWHVAATGYESLQKPAISCSHLQPQAATCPISHL